MEMLTEMRDNGPAEERALQTWRDNTELTSIRSWVNVPLRFEGHLAAVPAANTAQQPLSVGQLTSVHQHTATALAQGGERSAQQLSAPVPRPGDVSLQLGSKRTNYRGNSAPPLSLFSFRPPNRKAGLIFESLEK